LASCCERGLLPSCGVWASHCGKGKAKIKKVKGSGGGRDRRLGRAGKVDKGGNGEELQRRKCQEKGEQHIFAQTLWPESSF